jgi:hypothetical protein
MNEREELLLEIRATLDKATKYLKIIAGILLFWLFIFLVFWWETHEFFTFYIDLFIRDMMGE